MKPENPNKGLCRENYCNNFNTFFSLGERILMLIDLMLVLALFLTNVLDIIPGAAGEVPFFTYFLVLTLIGMVINILTMVYTLSIYFANHMVLEMPRWLRY